jgi:hypothetical protein
MEHEAHLLTTLENFFVSFFFGLKTFKIVVESYTTYFNIMYQNNVSTKRIVIAS